MAKVTNAFDTYSAQANREDLTDGIYNIDPFDTPLMTLAGRTSASNVLHEWQTEELPAVDTSNAAVEGFELSRSAAKATTRVQNYCQISYRDATVTGTQQRSRAAGKKSEMAHQMALAAKALKRDMESIMSQNQGYAAGNSTTARKTRAFESWMTTNTSRGPGSGTAGADAPNATSPPVDANSQRAFTETLLQGVLQDCYTNGAEPTTLLVGAYNKMQVSGFSGRSSAYSSVNATTVQQSVTLYASDFGDIQVMPSRRIRPRSALLIDPEYIAVAYYRPMQQRPIAPIGDAETRMLLAEYCLEMRNEAAHGIVADLKTS